MPKTIHITETVLRDANQSLCATRIPIEDFVDILDTMDGKTLAYVMVPGLGEEKGETHSSYDALLDPASTRECITRTPYGDLLRSGAALSGARFPMSFCAMSAKRLISSGLDSTALSRSSSSLIFRFRAGRAFPQGLCPRSLRGSA